MLFYNRCLTQKKNCFEKENFHESFFKNNNQTYRSFKSYTFNVVLRFCVYEI